MAALLAASLLAAAAGIANAGAWTQPVGGYYLKLAYAGMDTRTRYDASGERVPYQTFGSIARDAEYRNREIRGYAEYGVRDRLTAYGSLAHKRLAVEERAARRETYGFGDLVFGARWRLTSGGPPLSLAAELALPSGYATSDHPALGAGQADLTVKALAGVSGAGWYATGDLGWMERGGDYRSQVVAALEAGGRAGGRIGGRTVLRWAESVGGGATAGAGEGFDPARASPRVLALDGAIGVDLIAGTVLEVSLSGVLAGRDALAGRSIEVALVRAGRTGR